MTGAVLIEEKLDRYQPLGAFGQPVYQSHVQLQAALRQRLGQRYADFFAIPHLNSATGRVSWTSPVAGEARRWSDLPPDEQATRALDLQVMKSEFQTYLDELRAYEQGGDQPRGAKAFMAVLEQALRTPNDGHLFFVEDQPVATFWGFREEEAAPFETLAAAPGMRPPPAAAAPVVEVRNWRWLWWLLPLLLLLLALLLWWFWPEEPAVDPFKDEAVTEEPLTDPPVEEEEPLPERERPAVIVDENGRVVPTETVPGESVPGEVVPEDVVPADDVDTNGDVEVPADDAETPADVEAPEAPEAEPEQPEVPEAPEPEIPETPETPEPEAPEPETPEAEAPENEARTEPDPGEAPAIPDDAPDGAAGFMQGRWTSDSGLIDAKTRQKLVQEYQFDENGKGEAILRREDGVTCRAPATATVNGGNLEVEEQENLACSDGSTFARSRTVCRKGPSGRTECIGTDSQGDRYKVDINRGVQP